MSKFSKLAKFLSILTAVSAVSKTSATDKYVPASIEAQNSNRAIFKNNNRFSIDPKSAAVGGVVVGAITTSALLLSNLFSNKENEKCLYFFIETLKFNKICKFKIEVKNGEIQIAFHGDDPRNPISFEELLNYQKISNPQEKQSYMNLLGIKDIIEGAGSADGYKVEINNQKMLKEARRKFNIGLNVFKQSLADYLYVFNDGRIYTSFSVDKDGNFLINNNSIENYKNSMKEKIEKNQNKIKGLIKQYENDIRGGMKESIAKNTMDYEKLEHDSNIANTEKERQIVLKICENKVIKEVLNTAHKNGIH